MQKENTRHAKNKEKAKDSGQLFLCFIAFCNFNLSQLHSICWGWQKPLLFFFFPKCSRVYKVILEVAVMFYSFLDTVFHVHLYCQVTTRLPIFQTTAKNWKEIVELFKMKHKRFCMNIRKNLFTVQMTKHQHRLPREALEFSLIEDKYR